MSISEQLTSLACLQGAEQAYKEVQDFSLGLTNEGRYKLIRMISETLTYTDDELAVFNGLSTLLKAPR